MTTAKQSNNTETMAYANSVQYLCRFMCVYYCVRAPQRDDCDLFYLIKVSQTQNVFPSITRQKITSCCTLSICWNLKTFPEQCRGLEQPCVLPSWLNFLRLLWKPFRNKGFHSSLRGYILEQGRPEMAPTTTGREAGSSSTHTASHSDLGEKQAFKQVVCLSAGGECQPLVLP